MNVRLVVSPDGEEFVCKAYDADTMRAKAYETTGLSHQEAIGEMIKHLIGRTKGVVEIHNLRIET